MKIHTFGDPGDPAVVLIHPMLLTGRQMIDRLGKKFSGHYYLIAPDQGGHGEDSSPYAPGKDAEALHRFLKEKGIADVRILYAASMGGVMSMRLLSLGGIRYHTVRMEGIPLRNAGASKALLGILGLLRTRNQARQDPAAIAAKLAPAFGADLARSMAEQLGRLSRKNICRIQWACVFGSAVPLDRSGIDHMTFEWGEKEVNSRGKPLAEQMYPWAETVILPGRGHCERLSKDTDRLAAELEDSVLP